MSITTARALEVLTELRDRGDAPAPELGKRKLKAAELGELVKLGLASEAGKAQAKVYGITGRGQRLLEEKESAHEP